MDEVSYLQELAELQSKGLKRDIPPSLGPGLINLSSNDYLGLSQHPQVKEAAEKAVKQHGAGATASRLLAGTHDLHRRLETELTRFLGKERVLVFPSGYHINVGVLPVLMKTGDIIFVDELCHASILDGVRLSESRFCTFEHNNVDHLESLLRTRRSNYKRAVIVTEGIFSMDGDTGILPEIVFLAKKWKTMVYLDEAHSFGLMGAEGRGLAAELDLLKDVDIFVATLSKVLGSQGGFVACNATLGDLLISRCRSFIYTTALSPANAGAALAALRLLPSCEDRRKSLQQASQNLKEKLTELGYETLKSQSQIIPVWTGDIETTKKLSDYLFSVGYFVPSIRPPTVPHGQGRVRLSITHEVLQQGLEGIVRAFSSYQEMLRRIKESVV